MNSCTHPKCSIEVADHELACRSHWYELPTRLRNRIWKHFRHDPGGPAHRKAITEAIHYWTPRVPGRLRCHNCRRYTEFDQTDVDTGLPICLTCATAGMDKTAGPGPCSICGRERSDDLLVSFTGRPPHVCIDCTIDDLLHLEAYA